MTTRQPSLSFLLAVILVLFTGIIKSARASPIISQAAAGQPVGDADGSHGAQSVPNTNDEGTTSSGSNTNTTDSGSGSGTVIANQPATVQLGAGFIVGCVIGVILYTATRVVMRSFQRTVAARRERQRRQQLAVGTLLDLDV